jgi:hypothetical protein
MNCARWITIGFVKSPHAFMWFNWGVPFGLLMQWRGRMTVFQPMQFLSWRDLFDAILIRLALANLQLIALASVIGADRLARGGVELIALVKRLRNKKAGATKHRPK